MSAEPGLQAAVDEARRQIEICNACRYCEGFCAVFPAMTRDKSFAAPQLLHLANLCHNCRGCYYACQYTQPHEFALNLPAALDSLRHAGWQQFARPSAMARFVQTSGSAIAGLVIFAIALLAIAAALWHPTGGRAFYAVLSHRTMAGLFGATFLLALASLGLGLRQYWQASQAPPLRPRALFRALGEAASLRNLDGGQGQGCNFEKGDRYTDTRRWAHHSVVLGFLLCFAATCAATFLHYAMGLRAPYGPLSLPKLLGLPGGVLLCLGTAWLLALRRRAQADLVAQAAEPGALGFIWLLFVVAASGLALYAARGSLLATPLLIGHLGAVLAFFLTLPYSKMVHGAYRIAALAAEAGRRATP